MDVVMLKDIVIGVAAVLAAGLAIWNFFQSPSKANAAAIVAVDGRLESKASAAAVDALETKIAEHDRRIQAVEGELKHLPDKDAVNDLKLAISELKGAVGRLDAQVGTAVKTVDRIDTYLRKEAS